MLFGGLKRVRDGESRMATAAAGGPQRAKRRAPEGACVAETGWLPLLAKDVMASDEVGIVAMPSKVVPQVLNLSLKESSGTGFCFLAPQSEYRRQSMDDSFEIYDLKVEVTATDRPMVCSHRVGDYFLVEGENLVFPENNTFSMYALAAILPVLPAKQRVRDKHDWMSTDAYIACPDPNCGARFRITRTKLRRQSHSECTVVPLECTD